MVGMLLLAKENDDIWQVKARPVAARDFTALWVTDSHLVRDLLSRR
ncbi:MAG: hypothetical protein ACOY4P_05380 [Pseudomonadota bacterium]|jgi:hypothetical protein